MGRTRKNRDLPHPKPVEKIQLSEKHTTARLALVITLLIVGAACLGVAFSRLFSSEGGWAEITASSSGLSSADEFVLLYNLGQTDASATAEKRAVTALYSEAAQTAYALFTADDLEEDETEEPTHNVWYLNQHPNEEIVVDEALYNAFALLDAYGDRSIYLAPVYAQYDDLFLITDDAQAVDYDPAESEDVAEEYAAVAEFANDADSVQVELLGDNTVKLSVSSDYLRYAEENGITSFVDFFWLKNAFVADYLAEVLTENGYTNGVLSSFDGYSRTLSADGTTYSTNIYHYEAGTLRTAAVLSYEGPMAVVTLRSYPFSEEDSVYYYTYADGELRSRYLDTADGFCKTAVDTLTAYGQGLSCAEIALQLRPIYIADTLDEDALCALAQEGVDSVWCAGSEVRYTQQDAALDSLYEDDTVQYHAAAVS